MLDDFILKQLNELELERENLSQQLIEITRQEADANSRIQRLLEQEDMGVEVFSPRSANHPVKQQIADVRQQISEIQYQQAELQNKLEQNAEKAEQYQQLLLEAREKVKIASLEQETAQDSALSDVISPEGRASFQQYRQETKEELETILRRVDRCLDLIHTDRVNCKNELKNLRYYLKAILTKQTENQ